MEAAADVLRIAWAELGYLEKASNKDLDSKTENAGKANYTKFARDLDAIYGWYNGPKQGFDWCAVFVEWCFIRAYGAELAKRVLPHSIYSAGCTQARAMYASAGRFSTTPKVGDQVFFYNSKGLVGHTGLVVAVDRDTITTIEGNTSAAAGVVANGGCVREKKYPITYNRIAGYGHPDYDALPKEPEPEKEDKPMTEERYQTLTEIERDCPWAAPTVQKLIRRQAILGDGTGLDLSRDMLRLLVINDRAGCYGD